MNSGISTVQAVKRVLVEIDTSRAYGRSLLAGIAEYSRRNGLWAFCHNEPNCSNDASPSLQQILDWKPDGIITRSAETVELLSRHEIPMVVAIHLENTYPGVPRIKGDNGAMGRMAADYLLKLGFHHFAFCGFNRRFWSQERCRAFEKTVAEAGYKTDVFSEQGENPSSESVQRAMVDWLKTLVKPVAVMVCNDDRGKQLIEAAKIAGVQVPDDVAIIGVDNDEVVCDLCYPALSSIKLDNLQAGYRAAKLLDLMMDGKRPDIEEIVVQPIGIAVRQSTDIYCVPDPQVSQALEYICDHSREMIQVSDVADFVCLSKRALQLRFKNALGYSVHDRIKKEKINRMAELLTDTDMSIIEIALNLGFSNTNHVSRFFRQEKGMSPFAYRKQYAIE